MKRILIAAAVVVASVAAPILVTAPVASAAATTCTVKANLPGRIAITKHYTELPVKLTGCTGRVNWAGVDIYGAGGLLDMLMWNGSPDTDYLAVYDWETMGTYHAVNGVGSSMPDFESLNWSASTTVIKYGSSIAESVTRASGITRVTATVRHWDPNYNIWGGWAPSAKQAVTLYSAPTSTGPWTQVGLASTGSNGSIIFSGHVSTVRYWQARTSDSTRVFGGKSSVHRG
jgi:hypothetical protein